MTIDRRVKIKSDYAILDVKAGRQMLTNHFAERPHMGPCQEAMRIPVRIFGYLDIIYGGDDGVSRKFNVIVQKVLTEPGQFADALANLCTSELLAAKTDHERAAEMVERLAHCLAFSISIIAAGNPDATQTLMTGVEAYLYESAADLAPIAKKARS